MPWPFWNYSKAWVQDWPPVSSDARSLKDPLSGKTGKLSTESCSGVSILVTALIAALIGQRDGKPNCWLHCHHTNACTSLGLLSWPMIVAKYFPKFRGNWKWLSLQTIRVHLRDCSLKEDCSRLQIAVQWTQWGSKTVCTNASTLNLHKHTTPVAVAPSHLSFALIPEWLQHELILLLHSTLV